MGPQEHPSNPLTQSYLEPAGGGGYPPLPTPHGQSANQQQLGGAAGPPKPNSWVGNDANTLLVVATLITTLTYQLGTSIPGGYWQQDTPASGGKVVYRAGDPIMRDLHRPRYWVFMGASWVGFASSMVMTLSLLVRMPVGSRHVRWSVVAYSSLVLTFVVSQPRTHLSLDLLIWAAVLAFLWIIVSLHPDHRARVIQDLCCSGGRGT
ncbi:hypothetical protein PVAP13_9KG516726 [Panicum virgatum]|uniref:PGG domain-containing protein n=1 Tax=Panicum virgatum TaxID=38727 RepID=A0A8T0NUH9_PANVG|nr:hypothetical protein PVAP13_9KG516726 [Panicum virgatum]